MSSISGLQRSLSLLVVCSALLLYIVVAVFDEPTELQLALRVREISPELVAQERLRAKDGRFTSAVVRNGVPDGVQCDVTQRCDSRNVCARVCERGTVKVDPWLRFAVDYQWRLARRQPLCFAQLLGTHNSAISLADGYGMHDDIYTQYLRYLGMASGSQRLTTNNQVLSLTDQLELGVRFVELDVHWIQSSLRIAHCGGFHSARLNALVRLLSEVARLFGHPPVEWDAETLGCDPSLSSLPTADQRSFASALAEVAAWLLGPEPPEPPPTDGGRAPVPAPAPGPGPPLRGGGRGSEFLVLYLDDQPDLGEWGHVGELLEQVTAAIPEELIISPAQLRALTQELGSPPSIDQLVGTYGKRVLVMSASDYGASMSHLVHDHTSPCNLSEPLFRSFTGAPNCSFHSWRYPGYMPAMDGRLIRTPTCHLTYGFYNCSMQRGENTPQLDADSLPEATSCGINVPAPDMLTPDLLSAYVWSWAPGHPPPPPAAATAAAATAAIAATANAAGMAAAGADGAAAAPDAQPGPAAEAVAAVGEEQCGMLRSSDGRWVVAPCNAARLVACRPDAGPQHLWGGGDWVLVDPGAACPRGYVPGAPHTARENYALWRAVTQLAHRPSALRQAAVPPPLSSRTGATGATGKGGTRGQAKPVRRAASAVDGESGVAGPISADGGTLGRPAAASSAADGALSSRRSRRRLQSRQAAGAAGGGSRVAAAARGEGEGEGDEVLVRLALRPPSWLP